MNHLLRMNAGGAQPPSPAPAPQLWRERGVGSGPQGQRVGGLTMNTLFSWAVWKRPWPNLEVVSMNLSSMFSRAWRLWCTRRDWEKRVRCRVLAHRLPPPQATRRSRSAPARTPPFLPVLFPLSSERGGGQGRPVPRPSHHRGADLPQRDDPLLGARDATLQHDEVVVDFPVVGEASLRGGGSGRRLRKGLQG